MGAKYHTVHHTHYHYNFGQVSAAYPKLCSAESTHTNLFGCVQFFVLMDWIFGTLRVPDKEKFA
jgi:sterol desaturase/sphingolipid hydroxylase (fatty acid hydroxylase superfamily)